MFIIIAIIIGLIPAMVAAFKGKNFFLWWFFGAALFIVALPWALLMETDPAAKERQKYEAGMVKCPFCAEFIKREAHVCRFCGREIRWSKSTTKSRKIIDPVEEWERQQQKEAAKLAMNKPVENSPVLCPHCQVPIDISGLSAGTYNCPNCQGSIELS